MSFAFIEGNALYKRRLIASGYARRYFVDGYIPEVILRLFVDYCKDSISWRISHEQFIAFQHKAEQRINIHNNNSHWSSPYLLYGPMFSVRGLEFECNIASVSDAEFIQFQIRLKSINLNKSTMPTSSYITGELNHANAMKANNIRQIIVYYEVRCDETQSSEKDTKILREIGDEISWPMYNMRVKECINLQSFTFNVYVDIFKIDYKKLYQMHEPLAITENKSLCILKDTYYRPIIMYNKVRYSWNIDAKLVETFKQSHFGKYWYSPNFGLFGDEINGNNFAWCLYVAPHGYNYSMNDRVYLGIVLLNLPPKIREIEIDFVMQCYVPSQRHNVRYQQSGKVMHFRDNCAAWPGSEKLKILECDSRQGMVVSIDIEVVRVANHNGRDLNKDDWPYLGILKKSKYPKFEMSKYFQWLQYLHQK